MLNRRNWKAIINYYFICMIAAKIQFTILQSDVFQPTETRHIQCRFSHVEFLWTTFKRLLRRLKVISHRNEKIRPKGSQILESFFHAVYYSTVINNHSDNHKFHIPRPEGILCPAKSRSEFLNSIQSLRSVSLNW